MLKDFNMSGNIRGFISFDICKQELLDKLRKVQQMLRETGADLKLVSPQNIHVTIRFLGNIPESMVDNIHAEMKKVSFGPFHAEIRRVGAFPALKRPRVVWAGLERGSEKMRDVFNQLEPHIRKLRFNPDSKGFSPHLTIARVRTKRNEPALISCLRTLSDYRFGEFEVRCLKLKKSRLTPEGPIYSTLREVCPGEINRFNEKLKI
ncbi:MAG: RNA 2',3'-cyclic phosphodiesterase [Candidatus Bathyarchaeota archaeon]|nr:MAG: RNA 2',3'-cyclic phosphodiesterase [Candidatus Bathyarchaeota archaeon]